MRRLLLTGILVVGVLSGFVEGGTVAYFTSAATSAGNQFTAGTLTLAAGIASGTLTVSNVVPGDSFTAQLTIQNGGNLDLRYAMASDTVGDADLKSALQLTVRTKTANPCSSLDGSVLYGPGNLDAAAFGSTAQGAQAGDRELAAGASEDLCFAVQLPSSASTTLQGKSVTVTFTFAAEQKAGT
ncbi:MAG: hypothetical protein HY690_09270 [Chloroflexi bacterium]|nr:hypothetical protein [Chloroflexota bacterium]